MKIISVNPQASQKEILEIVGLLKEGKVIVFPTDTVYGLICDASNEKAVENIFKIKQRDKEKSLPVFVKDLILAKEVALINEAQGDFLKENWPGSITVVLKAKNKNLSKLVYQGGTIALRVPDYRMLNMVLREFGGPIAQTSANISGSPAVTKVNELLEQLETSEFQPDVIINAGDLAENKPSKIIDFSNNKIEIIRN